MHLFHQPNISLNYLPEQESQHAIRVLRMQTGDEIIVLDGVGGFHHAKITMAHPRKCQFEIINSKLDIQNRLYHLHIAIAPTKNIDRIEWFIEKAVEIGIDEITLLKCQFSERKQLNFDRLEKLIVSAAKQSMQTFFPILHPMIQFDEFIKDNADDDKTAKFIAHCYPDEKQPLKTAIQNQNKILILIGPEGDFSQDEVALAQAHQYVPVTLGESRLRTETAGILSCATAAVIL